MINNGWNRLEKISFAVFIVTLLVALFIFLLMEIINIRHADDVSTQPSKKGNYLAVNAPKQETSTSSNSGSFVLSSALLVAPEKAHVSNSLISMDASTNVAQTFPARHEDSISNNNLSHSINSPTNTVFDSSVQFALARESSNRENAMALEFSDETSLNDKSAQQSRLDSTQPFVSNVTVVATEDFADVPLLPAEIIINACWNTAVKPPSDDSVNVNFPGNNQLLAIPVWAATSIIVKGIEIIAWPIEKLREPKHARFDQEIFSNNYRNHKYKYRGKISKVDKKNNTIIFVSDGKSEKSYSVVARLSAPVDQFRFTIKSGIQVVVSGNLVALGDVKSSSPGANLLVFDNAQVCAITNLSSRQ